MDEKQDVGLEEVEDFVESETEQAEKKNEQSSAQLETVQSFEWKEVSHIVIGPKGVSLVPAGMDAKFTKTSADTETPTPGMTDVMEYDLEKIVGAMNAVSDLEKELADTKAELERVKSEHAEPKDEEKPEDEMPEDEEEEKESETEPAVDDQKDKEDEAKKEKEDAETKQPKGKVEADHSEPNFTDLMKGLKAAKERKIL